MQPSSRFRIRGFDIDVLTLADFVRVVSIASKADRPQIIANHNLHSVYLYHVSDAMKEFYSRADYVYTDGMGLVVLARILGVPLSRANRLTCLDCLRPILAEAALEGRRVFHLGGKQGVGVRGAEHLRRRYPYLQITTAHGYFDDRPGSEDNRKVLQALWTYRPDILLVGMGMPRQERWIVNHLGQLPPCAILSVGAYMDYVAGEVPAAPRWMGKAGLEWLFRLCAEPRRLWRRYLVEPWFVLWLLFGGYSG